MPSRRLINESKKWPNNWYLFKDYEEFIITDDIIPGKHIELIFIFKKTYPFRPPTVYLKNIDIIQYFKTSMIYLEDIQKIMNKKCMCCDNLLCKYKWGPTKTVIDIVNEIIYFFKLKQRLMERFHCKKITYKYLIEHLRLYEYL